MNRIIELLEEKNHYLEKFYKLNERELINLSDQNFENIEVFYAGREGLLKMVSKIDEMVDEQIVINEIDVKAISGIHKKKLISALSYKTEVVNLILAQDLQIISFVEQAKTQLIGELSKVKAERKLIDGIKLTSPS